MGNGRSFKPSETRSVARRGLAQVGYPRGKKPRRTARARQRDEMIRSVNASGHYTCPHCGIDATVVQDGLLTRVDLEHADRCRILKDRRVHDTPQV